MATTPKALAAYRGQPTPERTRCAARQCTATVFGGLGISLCLAVGLPGQTPEGDDRATQIPPLELSDFHPQPKLKVVQTRLRQASFPVVDVHTHFKFKLRGSDQALDDYVRLMDQHNIATCVSLDGRLGDEWEAHEELLWTKYRDRFVIFVHLNWRGDAREDDVANWDCHRPDFARRTVALLREARERGASGLKLFKSFGLGLENPDGSLVAIDDARFDPIWQVCGELGMPVIMHTADPAAFFDPIDANNERYEELQRHPDWSFHGERFPSRAELLAARNRIIQRHPKTRFIGAHMANNAEDLEEVGKWLDRLPNLYVEFASRINELGRQPYTARDFLIKYQDRVMFGTDGPWPATRVGLYWRFLETRDEYFPYSEKVPAPQGLWRIYGVHLPDDVLRKIYHVNAARIIPGVQERLEKFDLRDR